MPSLFDIAPPEIATEAVDIRGMAIEVRGLSARAIARLMKRFPDMRAQSAGRDVSQDDMLVTGIEAAPAIIAEGLVEPVPEEEIVRRLSPDEQASLIAAIMRLTNPPAPAGPLAEGAADGARSTEDPVTN